MSRPRPRPRARAPPQPAPTSASEDTAGPSIAPETSANDSTQNDLDEFFNLSRKRTAEEWRERDLRAQKAAKEAPQYSDSDSDSPGRRRRRRVGDENKTLKNVVRLLNSHDDEDGERASTSERRTTRSPSARLASLTPSKRRKQQDTRKRSLSLTPPPEDPYSEMLAASSDTRRNTQAYNPPPQRLDDSFEIFPVDEPEDDPEIVAMRERFKGRVAEEDVGDRETATVTLKWVPHPNNKYEQASVDTFTYQRNVPLHDLFEDYVEDKCQLLPDVTFTYEGRVVFPSSKLTTLKVWSEATFEASLNVTYEYLQQQKDRNVLEIEGDSSDLDPTANLPLPVAEPEVADKMRLTFRSPSHSQTLTVRPTATCGTIVRAFLKACGIDLSKEKTVRLVVDGEKMDSAAPISEADLEDGDLVEVTGI